MRVADFIFAAGSITFAVALIPMLLSDKKPPLSTSVPTAFWLFMFGGTYATQGFPLAAITSTISGGLWTALAIQRYALRKSN